MSCWRALFSLVLATGCGHAVPPPPPPPSDVQLQIGTAEAGGAGFAAMPATATLVPGAQGGFHIWVSYRVSGAGNEHLKATHTVRRVSDGKLLSHGERRLDVSDAGADGWWHSDQATPAFLCPPPLGVSVIDEHAVFEVTLSSPDGGTLATDSVTTQLTCPTDAQNSFCLNICAG